MRPADVFSITASGIYVNTARDNSSPQMVICMFLYEFIFCRGHCLVGERSELLCLVSCIYLFLNKYNWLCVLVAIVRQRKPGAEAGWGISLITVRFHGIGQEIKIRQSEPTKI